MDTILPISGPSLPSRAPDDILFYPTEEKARYIAACLGLRISHVVFHPDPAYIFVDNLNEEPDPKNPTEYFGEVREVSEGRWRLRIWA